MVGGTHGAAVKQTERLDRCAEVRARQQAALPAGLELEFKGLDGTHRRIWMEELNRGCFNQYQSNILSSEGFMIRSDLR